MPLSAIEFTLPFFYFFNFLRSRRWEHSLGCCADWCYYREWNRFVKPSPHLFIGWRQWRGRLTDGRLRSGRGPVTSFGLRARGGLVNLGLGWPGITLGFLAFSTSFALAAFLGSFSIFASFGSSSFRARADRSPLIRQLIIRLRVICLVSRSL